MYCYSILYIDMNVLPCLLLITAFRVHTAFLKKLNMNNVHSDS